MEVGMEEHGRALTDYFNLKSTNDNVRAVLLGFDGTPRSILQVLMAHFKEEMDAIFIEADMSATAADVENYGLPSSPRLILLGK
ncbi:hypothetical protein PBY51_019547 [Eleginops maclovinus]|uniref:Uncharacterized protein n=1 Tax=Eleginops maclovinus TaxID=56733 RepID=A0AAN8ATJ0_ELEMC|nr:hypothetical protein PBY51_019547 [Eleginops maclovinus]